MTEEQKFPKKYNKHKPKLNYQLSRVLRHAKFSPLKKLLDDVYPRLEPKDQMYAIFKIMDYLYPRPKAIDTSGGKKVPGIQTNVQVNLPNGSKVEATSKPPSYADVVELIAAAEGKNDN